LRAYDNLLYLLILAWPYFGFYKTIRVAGCHVLSALCHSMDTGERAGTGEAP
jgi:hypothetical protein